MATSEGIVKERREANEESDALRVAIGLKGTQKCANWCDPRRLVWVLLVPGRVPASIVRVRVCVAFAR